MGQTIAYLLEAFVLLYIAKLVYSKIFRKVDLKAELYARNNYALAVAVSGYFFGICLALGGALVGQSQGWQADLIAIGLYGILAIVLMLIAGFLCEKILLHSFSNTKEIIEDQNLGTAFVEAGIHIANGLIVLAIVNGDYSGWLVGLQVFAMKVGFGFVALYGIHKLTDVLLAPGISLGREQVKQQPNVGAGLIEAIGYLGGSTLIVWIF